MKVCLLIFFTAILSNTSFGQSSQDEQLVKNVVKASRQRSCKKRLLRTFVCTFCFNFR